MTTDTRLKEIAVEFTAGGKACRIGGIAKGSGMINPNMATMLSFLTSDVNITSELLSKALTASAGDTFNMVSVDGDTSTNDMLSILANGTAGNVKITADGVDYDAFYAALNTVNTYLARMIAKDGEGATKLVTCTINGAPDTRAAKLSAKSVIASSLVKAAMFGADANWGRILCALGYTPCAVDITKIDVSFASAAGKIAVCENGAGLPFDEDKAKNVLLQDEIEILIDMKQGMGKATAWGCDLTYDYVKINGDYRT
jgi:glutamate N-acetyltransferase/amino-acid N-acetyltransferase